MADPSPSKSWLLIDEREDSINDGFFVVDSWSDPDPAENTRTCGLYSLNISDSTAKMACAVRASILPTRRTSRPLSTQRKAVHASLWL